MSRTRKTIISVASISMVVALVAAAAMWLQAFSLASARRAFNDGQFAVAAQLAEQRLATSDPNDQNAMLIAGRAHARLGRWPEAEAYFAQVPLRKREDLRLRARGLETRRLWTESSFVYEQIVQRWPDDGDALQHLAALRVQQDRGNEALILARRLAQLPTHRVVGHVLCGMIDHQMRNDERAVKAFEEALRLSPELEGIPTERWQVYLWLAEALVDLGRAAEAEKYALEVRDRSANADPSFLLGRTRQQLGDDAAAVKYWIEATARNPNYVPALKELAQYHLRVGELDEALKWCRRALEVEPENESMKYILESIERRRNASPASDQSPP